jgi:hypothetical protein
VEVERTQSGIEAALSKWASLRRKKARIEAEQTNELTPIRERFERASAPVLAKYAPRLTPVEDELRRLEDAIRAAVLGATDRHGEPRFPRVATDTAEAVIATRSEREIDPHDFFKSFTLPGRDARFWACFKVYVGKAEKLLGAAALDAISRLKQNRSVQINEL